LNAGNPFRKKDNRREFLYPGFLKLIFSRPVTPTFKGMQKIQISKFRPCLPFQSGKTLMQVALIDKVHEVIELHSLIFSRSL
jgi:hypothetical protein